MAARKMTFSIPDDVADRFVRAVPAQDRSRFLTQVLEKSMLERDLDLVRACQEANEIEDLLAIEQEFSALPNTMTEPGDGPSAR